MANVVYNRAKVLSLTGALDLVGGDIRILLVESGYTADADHNFVSSVTNELSGTGYSRQVLTGNAVTQDDTNDRAVFDADNVTWTGINAGTAAGAIIYKHVTNDADSPLVAYLEISPAVVTNGGDLVVTPNVSGFLRAA